MDTPGLPRQRDRACDMIKQAGGAPRVGLMVAAPGHLARKTDGAIGERAQAIAPSARNGGAVIEPGVQVGGKCCVGAMAANRPRERVDGDDVAGAFPDRAEMSITQ